MLLFSYQKDTKKKKIPNKHKMLKLINCYAIFLGPGSVMLFIDVVWNFIFVSESCSGNACCIKTSIVYAESCLQGI